MSDAIDADDIMTRDQKRETIKQIQDGEFDEASAEAAVLAKFDERLKKHLIMLGRQPSRMAIIKAHTAISHDAMAMLKALDKHRNSTR